MNIKNYTSQVSSESSITKIEKQLILSGANNILKNYENGLLKSISFTLDTNGSRIAFRLESKVDRIYQLLMKEYVRPTDKSRQLATEQAERTAWKIISDWVIIQLTMITLDQADFLQLFLAASVNPKTGQTFYARLKDNNFMLLEGGKA